MMARAANNSSSRHRARRDAKTGNGVGAAERRRGREGNNGLGQNTYSLRCNYEDDDLVGG